MAAVREACMLHGTFSILIKNGMVVLLSVTLACTRVPIPCVSPTRGLTFTAASSVRHDCVCVPSNVCPQETVWTIVVHESQFAGSGKMIGPINPATLMLFQICHRVQKLP